MKDIAVATVIGEKSAVAAEVCGKDMVVLAVVATVVDVNMASVVTKTVMV